MPRAIRFEVWRDETLVDATTLTQDVIKIGRLPSSHVRIDDEGVARMHAVVEVHGEHLRVVDLGSARGTAVNGSRVHKSARIELGDALAVGPVQIRVLEPTLAPARPLAIPASDTTDHCEAPDVAEVIAMFGNTVLDVQHVGERVGRRVAYGLLALGGVMLLGGAGYVASQTVLQQRAWSAYEVEATEAARTGRPTPVAPGSAWAGIGAVLGLAGLIPLGLGAVRLRDRDMSRFTIGEGPDISFATTTTALPDPTGFPLVSTESQGAPRIAFTSQMTGSVSVGAHRYSLEQLASSGQAVRDGAAFSFPLPSGARCRIRHDDTTFHINAVKPGRVVAGRGARDKAFWMYNAASLVGLGTLLGLAQLALPLEGDLALESTHADNRFVGYIQQPDLAEKDDAQDDPVDEEDDGAAKQEPGASGKRAPGSEGKMGNPDSPSPQPRRYALKGPRDAAVVLSRNASPDVEARRAGILGLLLEESGSHLASPTGGAFAMGNQDDDLWGSMTGTELGDSHGFGGVGLVGTGRGGGGNADGVVGLATVGLMGGRGSCADGDCRGLDYSRGRGTHFDGRKRKKPRPRLGKLVARGALDKDLIRRVVRAHINEISHCYNQGLVRDPNLRGRVAIQFNIGPSGKVPLAVVASSSIKDSNVSNCIAKAVKRWRFPKPDGGGTVMVTYPFLLNAGNV